jgi:hypothetical protein
MALPFQTPDNERSFSGLIDSAILQTGKAGSLIAAVSAANLTIRECQSFGLFAKDLIEEDPLTVTLPMTWTRPANFRRIRTVKYLAADVYPKLVLPGRAQRNKDAYFYAADNYYVFVGASTSDTIGLATYYWRKRLSYYGRFGTLTEQYPGGPYTVRSAYYDNDQDAWVYLNLAETAYVLSLSDPTEEELRRNTNANWLVSDWYDMIVEGTKAKLFNSGDDNRANRAYAAYKAAQKTFQTTEAYEAEGF